MGVLNEEWKWRSANAGIRAMPVVKSPPIDPELTAVFDIDNSRDRRRNWTPSERKSGAERKTTDRTTRWRISMTLERPSETRGTTPTEKPEPRQISFLLEPQPKSGHLL